MSPNPYIPGAEAARLSALGCGLNGWMQHFILERKDGVDSDETRTKLGLYCGGEYEGMGSLGARAGAGGDWAGSLQAEPNIAAIGAFTNREVLPYGRK